MATMQTTAIRATSRTYSTSVAPSSSRTKLLIYDLKFVIICNFLLPLVGIVYLALYVGRSHCGDRGSGRRPFERLKVRLQSASTLGLYSRFANLASFFLDRTFFIYT